MLFIYQAALTTSPQSLWSIIVASGRIDNLGNVSVSGTPNNQVLSDRCCNLDISSDTANGSITITISDRFGNSFNAFLPNTNFNKTSNRNSICLKDYFLQGSSGTPIADIAIEYI